MSGTSDQHLPDDPSGGATEARATRTGTDETTPAITEEPHAREARGDGDGDAGNGFAIGAIVLGLGAILIAPIILGPIAIILAMVARTRGQSLANWALIAAIGGTVIGLILAFVAIQALNGEAEALTALVR